MLRNLLVLSLTFLIQNLNSRLLCILSLYIIYDWITIMGLSNHDISTINMLYSSQKHCLITPLPPHNGYLFTTATFFCLLGGLCREVGLYILCSLDIFLRVPSHHMDTSLKETIFTMLPPTKLHWPLSLHPLAQRP